MICGSAPMSTPMTAPNIPCGSSSSVTDAQGSSGELTYVRVWHAGKLYSASVVLAGIGSSTVVDHCEAAFSGSDGFLLSGGAVNVRYLSALFNAGTGIAVDNGYVGKGQYLFALASNHTSASAFETNASESNGMSIESPHTLRWSLSPAGRRLAGYHSHASSKVAMSSKTLLFVGPNASSVRYVLIDCAMKKPSPTDRRVCQGGKGEVEVR